MLVISAGLQITFSMILLTEASAAGGSRWFAAVQWDAEVITCTQVPGHIGLGFLWSDKMPHVWISFDDGILHD